MSLFKHFQFILLWWQAQFIALIETFRVVKEGRELKSNYQSVALKARKSCPEYSLEFAYKIKSLGEKKKKSLLRSEIVEFTFSKSSMTKRNKN